MVNYAVVLFLIPIHASQRSILYKTTPVRWVLCKPSKTAQSTCCQNPIRLMHGLVRPKMRYSCVGGYSETDTRENIQRLQRYSLKKKYSRGSGAARVPLPARGRKMFEAAQKLFIFGRRSVRRQLKIFALAMGHSIATLSAEHKDRRE